MHLMGSLAGSTVRSTDIALIPVSSRAAVRNAILKFSGAAHRSAAHYSAAHRMNGLGDSAQVQGAAAGAAAGAKAGSIIPGIGTVIGAFIGAVVGWLGAKKPVRPTEEQLAQCQQLLADYDLYTSQSPDVPLPMSRQQLIDMNWCLDAVHGAKVGLRDPRWFTPDVEGVFIPMALTIVKKIYSTPVGATVNLGEISFKDPKGRSIKFSGYSFVNPVFTDLKSFADQFFIPMAVKMCQETAGKGSGGCESYYAQEPLFRRWLYDLLGWAAREALPNISESDLRAASQVASQVGTSAKDVVSAVESIIQRSVAREETAALLQMASQSTTQVIKDVAKEIAAQQPPADELTPEQMVTTTPVVTPTSVAPAILETAREQIKTASTTPSLFSAGLNVDPKLALGALALVFALAVPRRRK